VHGRLNQLGARPAIIGEAGFTGELLGGRNYTDVSLATRDIFWLSLLAGNTGVIGWEGACTAPEESALIARVFKEAGWWGRRRAQAKVAVLVRQLGKDYERLYAWQREAFRRGLALDFVLTPPAARHYPYVLDAARPSALPPGVSGPVVPSGHYRAYAWEAADGNLLVAYVWNEAGFNAVGNRVRKAGPLRLRFNFPRPLRVRCYDLDEQRLVWERGPLQHGSLFFPQTAADYVVAAAGS
jgi:hypothetical protein